jgi:hypothetical protein
MPFNFDAQVRADLRTEARRIAKEVMLLENRDDSLAWAVQRWLPTQARIVGLETLRRLARKHVAPDERVVGVIYQEPRRAYPDDPAIKEQAVVLTETGYAVKVGGRTWRVELADAYVSASASDFRQERHYTILLSIGEQFWTATPALYGPDARAEASRALALMVLAQQSLQEAKLDAEKKRQKSPPRSLARPAPRLIRAAHDAELVAADWMTYLGFGKARVTPIGVDAGIDVHAERGVAQVKFEAVPTGRPVVQGLFGAATGEGKPGVFFSSAGYTAEAVSWAERVGVALFRFDLQGEPEPVNQPARKLFDKAGKGRGAPPASATRRKSG